MNKQEILKYVGQKYQKEKLKPFRVGDTVRVHVRITEGTNTRIQVFEGVVISFKGTGATRTFGVRKISFGVGVERTFPLNSPNIEKLAIVRSGRVRRAKLYYLRSRVGKAARLDEKSVSNIDLKSIPPAKGPEANNPSDKNEELVAAKDK